METVRRTLPGIPSEDETPVPLKGRSESVRVGSGWADPASIVCRGCRYENRMSQSFFVLGIQHLYCRRCGNMIDRHGHPASTS